MPAPGAQPNLVPAVVERSLFDIDLSNGVNEWEPEESVEWSKYLVQAENFVLDGNKLKQRDGVEVVSDSGGTYGNCRIGSSGAGALTASAAPEFNLFRQLASPVSSATTVESVGPLPFYSVLSRSKIGPDSGSGFSDTTRQTVVGVARFPKYTIIGYESSIRRTSFRMLTIVVKDNASGAVLRIWTRQNGESGEYHLVGSDDRYLHIYMSDALSAPKWFAMDTHSLPASGVIVNATTNITGAAVGDRVGAVHAYIGGSVVITNGATVKIQKFTHSAASTVATVTGLTTVYGIDLDNLGNHYIVGVLTGVPNKYVIRVYSSTLVSVTTMVDAVNTTNVGIPRISVDDTVGTCRIIAYTSEVWDGSQFYQVAQVYQWASPSAAMTVIGYIPCVFEGSQPWFHNYRHFVQLQSVQFDSETVVDLVATSSCIVDITNVIGTSDEAGGSAGSFRPVCVLDTYNQATKPMNMNNAETGWVTAGYAETPGVAYRPHIPLDNSNDVIMSVNELSGNFQESPIVNTAVVVGSGRPSTLSMHDEVIGSGIVSSYDGYEVTEFGFVVAPHIMVKTAVAVGPGLTGQYTYVAVYSFTDRMGNKHYSRVSRPLVIDLTAQAVDICVTCPVITGRHRDCTITVYRTKTGGTQFFRLDARLSGDTGTSDIVDRTSVEFLVNEMSDDDLEDNPLLHRQPGTLGTPLDRYHALSSIHHIKHKDRIFYASGSTVYYSSFNVDAEAWWFNPAFSINVPGGTGDITGLSSMDGVLVVFKRTSISLIDGDGPSENGGSGTEFSLPRTIHSEFGCIDQRSIVSTPDGVMYRSHRGIELLSRKFQNVFIGKNIVRTASAYPKTLGATFNRTSGLVYMPITDSVDPNDALIGPEGATSVVLVYDTVNSAWMTHKYKAFSNIIDGQLYVQDMTSVTGSDGTETIYLTDINGLLLKSVSTHGYDSDDPTGSDRVDPPAIAKTGWIRSNSKQDRLRVSNLLLLTKAVDDGCTTNLTVDASYDYGLSSESPVNTWFGPTVYEIIASGNSSNIVQLDAQPSKEAVQAVQFTVTVDTPTNDDLTPYGTGGRLNILGLTAKVGVRGGGAKLPAANK